MSVSPKGPRQGQSQPLPARVAQEHRDFAKKVELHVRIDQLIRDLFADVDQGTITADKFDFEAWLLTWVQQGRRASGGRRSSVHTRILVQALRSCCDRVFHEEKGMYAQRLVDCSLEVVKSAGVSQQVPPDVHLRELQTVIEDRMQKMRSSPTSHGVGELMRVAAEKSKFDASDDVQGQRVEAAPRPMEFYPQDYDPLKAPLQVVRDMREWNDPKGRLWPDYAIRSLTENCKRMIDQHSGGEPREVVVPLFTYSVFFFHRKLWAVWIPFRGGGKWCSLPAELVVCIERHLKAIGDRPTDRLTDRPTDKDTEPNAEACSDRTGYPCQQMKLSDHTIKVLHGVIDMFTPKETLEARDADGLVYHDMIRFPNDLQRILHRGTPTADRSGAAGLPTTEQSGATGSPTTEQSGAAAQPTTELAGDYHCWAGLDLWLAPNKFIPHESPSSPRASRPQGAPSCGSEDDTVRGEPYVYLARYCLPEKQVGTVQHPLYDTVGWLPMPAAGAMFKYQPAADSNLQSAGDTRRGLSICDATGGARRAGDSGISPYSPASYSPNYDYHAHKGTSFVRPSSRRSRTPGAGIQVPLQPELASFACFPPPGVLEYVFSKRSQEELELASEGTRAADLGVARVLGRHQYNVRPVDLNETCTTLREDCLKEKNQANYKEELHKRMKKLLEDDRARDVSDEAQQKATDAPPSQFSIGAVLANVYQMKTGDDPTHSDSAIKPSALSIAHSLDIQRVERSSIIGCGDGSASTPTVTCQWAVAFSGKPYAIYGNFGGDDAKGPDAAQHCRCLPWFRVLRHFEDQPYWHLNASMRCLQLGPQDTSLTVSQDAKKSKKIIKDLDGKYMARDPAAIGAGLRAMAASFKTKKDRRRNRWQTLSRNVLRVAFNKAIFDEYRRRSMPYTIRWHDPVAEEWFHQTSEYATDGEGDQSCEEATAGYLAPYENTWRNADSPRERQSKAHWRMRGIPALHEPAPDRQGKGKKAVIKDTDMDSAKQQAGRSRRGSDPIIAKPEPHDAGQQPQVPGATGKVRDEFDGTDERWPVTRFNVDLTGSTECKLALGTWLLHQCRPLIWQIAKALHSLSPVVKKMRVKPDSLLLVYRGLRNAKLDPKVYAQGNMLLWGQFSSTSTDQGVAQSFAEGMNASVFTLQGLKCSLIAPWSRFGREEEWLFAPNSLWLVKAMLTEEQQQILGKSDIQLYEMEEVVSDQQMDHIQIRYSLSKAGTVASASVIFQAETAVDSGGFLNLSLDGQVDDGSTKESWIYSVKVTYDGWHQCPLQTSTQWMICDKAAAEGLFNVMVAGETQSIAPGYDAAPEKQKKLAINVERGIYRREGGDPISCAVLDNLDKILHVRADEVSLGFVPRHRSSFEVKVYDSRWNALLTIRKHAGRPTSAIEDPGAYLLGEILHRGVRIKHVDVRNNGITRNGTRALLEAVRSNPHVHACDLGTVQSQDNAAGNQQDASQDCGRSAQERVNLSQDEEARAINIRCLHNQGRITADKMEAFGPRWVEMAAYALYDCDSISLDFAGLFERDQRQATKRTFDFITLVFKYRFHSVPVRYNNEGVVCKETEAKAKSVTGKAISLRGALVAACTFAGPEQVKALLTMKEEDESPAGRKAMEDQRPAGRKAMDPRETDQFGESPVVKARRRRDRARLNAGLRLDGYKQSAPSGATGGCQDLPLWDEVIKMLHVAETEEVRPDLAGYQPDVDPDEEYWRLKNFGLVAMRMWEQKMRQGQDIVTELAEGLGKHYDWCDPDIRKLSEELQVKVLHKSWGKHSAFSKTPVERVRVSLLCHALFVYSSEQWGECIGDAEQGKQMQPGAEARQATAPEVTEKRKEANGIPSDLRTTCLALYDPQVWGTAETLEEHRRKLRQWVLSWAMINCIIAGTEEHNVSVDTPFVKCIDFIPASAFAKWITLRKGDSLGMAFGGLWQREQKNQAEGSQHQGTYSKRKPSGGEDWGRLASSISLSISGRCQGVAVEQLFLEKDREQNKNAVGPHLLLPSLMYNLVGDTDASEDKPVIEVQLVTRGSLLASDAELVAWRDTVLDSAVESEWRMCNKDPQDVAVAGTMLVAAGMMVVAATERPTRPPTTPDDDPGSPSGSESPRETVEVIDERIFHSHRLHLAAKHIKKAVDTRVRVVLKECNVWEDMVIRKKHGWEWKFKSVDKRFALPYMMRPACVLLYQLGRDRQRRDSSLSSWYRNVELKTPILDLNSKTDVIVDHAAIERYCHICRNPDSEHWPPEIDEDLKLVAEEQGQLHAEKAATDRASPRPSIARRLDEHDGSSTQRCPSGAQGTPTEDSEKPGLERLTPRHVFGSEQFRITVGELQQLVRSTKITTIKSMPSAFFQELCRRFTLNPRHIGEIRRNRFLPLREIGGLPGRERKKVQLGDLAKKDAASQKDRTEGRGGGGARSGEAAPGDGRTAQKAEQAVREAERLLLDRRNSEVPKGMLRAGAQETKEAMKEFYHEVIGSHAWYGFESEAEARCLMARSVAQLGNAMCISQKGYFLTDGNEEGVYNQICTKSDSPIVFLCAGAIDFCHQPSVEVEFDRYLNDKYTGFKQNCDMALYQRIRAQYECIFLAARSQGVRNPSMLPLGCGRALKVLSSNVASKDVCADIVDMYFHAQFELLSREDWGFVNYYLNAQEFVGRQVDELHKMLQKNGACNSTADGRWLRCNIVFHKKDSKFVAQKLAMRGESPGFLVPTDTEALILGLCGRTWEIGRTEDFFQTDQDWAATSTGVLGSFSICGPALGLDDVVLQLQSGKSLRLSVNEGQLLCIEQNDEGGTSTRGPFSFVAYDPKTRELRVDTSRKDADDPLLAAGGSVESKSMRVWKVARVQHRVLLRELDRILQLKASDGKGGRIQVVVPTQVKELEEGRIHKAHPDFSLSLQGIKLSDIDEVKKELDKCDVTEKDIKWLTRTKGPRLQDRKQDGGDKEKDAGEKEKVDMVETHCFLVEFATLDALLRAMARLPLDTCETFYEGEAALGTEGKDNKAKGILSRYPQGIKEQRHLVGTVLPFSMYAVRGDRKERFPTLSAGPESSLLLRRMERTVLRYPQELSRDTRLPCTLRPAWTLLRLLGIAEDVAKQLEEPFPFSWETIQREVDPVLDRLSKKEIPWEAASKQNSWPYDKEISKIRWPAYRNPRIDLSKPIECLQALAADKLVTLDGKEMDVTVRDLPKDVWYEEQCEAEAELLEKNGAGKEITRKAYYERHEHAGRATDVAFEEDRRKVACAEAIFGPKAFVISIADVCKLVQSAALITSGDCVEASGDISRAEEQPAWVPNEFLTALIGRFVHNVEYGSFFQMQRFRALNMLLDPAHVKTRRDSAEIQAEGLAKEYKALAKTIKDAGAWSCEPKHFMSRKTHYWNVEASIEVQGTGKLQQLTLNKMKVVHACQRLNFTLDTEYHEQCVEAFRGFTELAEKNHSWLGFQDQKHVERVLNKALIDYSTETCVAAQGYFMVGGDTKESSGEQKSEEGGMNQLHEITPAPITFLSTAAIDFGTSAATKNQAPLYFKQHKEARKGDASGWAEWRDGDVGKKLLEERVRTFYTVIFTAAQKHKVNTPCMLPIGLGVFLGNLKEPRHWYVKDEKGKDKLRAGITEQDVKDCQKLKKEIVEIYWNVQFGLLCEKDWGFDTYYMNAREFLGIASKILDKCAAKLHCNVVLHNRDIKFLAVALTYSSVWGEPRRVSFLNPSDTCAVIGGDMGMYWATGRDTDYVGEEDFAATSTGCLLNFNITGHALGLDDVRLLLRPVGDTAAGAGSGECGSQQDREDVAAGLRWSLRGKELVYELRRRKAEKPDVYASFEVESGVLVLKGKLECEGGKGQDERWELRGEGLVDDQTKCLGALKTAADRVGKHLLSPQQ